MPICEAAETLGDSMTLMGNLEPVGRLAQGSPQEVYRAARDCPRRGAVGGRFLLSAGGGLAPETSLEALLTLQRAVDDFRGQ